jgi:hypothetical protein
MEKKKKTKKKKKKRDKFMVFAHTGIGITRKSSIPGWVSPVTKRKHQKKNGKE